MYGMLSSTVDVERVEIALQDFQHWLWAWHRAMICNQPLKRLMRDTSADQPQDCLCNVERFVREAEGVLDAYPAYRDLSRLHGVLHDLADAMAVKTMNKEPIGVMEYDQLVGATMMIIEAFQSLILQMKKEQRRQKVKAARSR